MATSPATLNFLGGLSAGAGINMLTSVATDPSLGSIQLIGDSGLWVVAAGLLTAMATRIANTQATLERETAALTYDEASGIRKRLEASHRIYRRVLTVTTTATILLAILLIPHLLDGHRVRCAVVGCPQNEPQKDSPSPGRRNSSN